jgi:hypothetical protein
MYSTGTGMVPCGMVPAGMVPGTIPTRGYLVPAVRRGRTGGSVVLLLTTLSPAAAAAAGTTVLQGIMVLVPSLLTYDTIHTSTFFW